MLLNYHIGRFVLGSMCVGDLVRLGLSGVRVAGFSLQHGYEPTLPCHTPSYRLKLFSSQTFPRINTPSFLKFRHTLYLPACEDGTECTETSAYKIQTPGNYPEESIQHS